MTVLVVINQSQWISFAEFGSTDHSYIWLFWQAFCVTVMSLCTAQGGGESGCDLSLLNKEKIFPLILTKEGSRAVQQMNKISLLLAENVCMYSWNECVYSWRVFPKWDNLLQGTQVCFTRGFILTALCLMHGYYSCSSKAFLSVSGISLSNGLEDTEVISNN